MASIHNRNAMLYELFLIAKCDGAKENFDIMPVTPDNYEHFYILLQIKHGVYMGQTHIMEFKATYGKDADTMQYPINPPLVLFRTPIHHTNISTTGSICLDIFKDAKLWTSTNTISTVIRCIMLLLDSPNELSPWNKEASALYTMCQTNYKQMIKNIAVAEHSQYEQKAFAQFKSVADKISAVDIDSYSEWFPQLKGVTVDVKIYEEQLAAIVARKQRKPKTSEKKVNSFDRYKK